MTGLRGSDKKWLQENFGDRVSFDPIERVLYGHDIASVPSLFKPVLGKTTPAAVVQPESEAELGELMKWANEARIPLVPRAKATSGYGGVIPARGGVVVDFYRMKNVLAVDAASQTVTVEPAITWEKLDQALLPHGLTLRLYPTCLSVVVGGRLARPGRCRHRLLRVRLVQGERRQRPGRRCPAASPATSAARTSTSSPTPRARPGSSAESPSR